MPSLESSPTRNHNLLLVRISCSSAMGTSLWAVPLDFKPTDHFYFDTTPYDKATILSDSSGNVYTAKGLTANETGACGLPPGNAAAETALIKLAPDGSCVWARRVPSQLGYASRSKLFAVGAGQIAFGGWNGWAPATLTTLDLDGNVLWVAPLPAGISEIAFDADGDLMAIGTFEDTIDLGNGSLVSAGSTDVWLARYDATGVPVCRSRIGGVLDDYGGMSVDPLGNTLLWLQPGNGDVALLKFPPPP